VPNDPATGAPNRLIDGAVPKNDSGGAGGYGTAADYLRFAQALSAGTEKPVSVIFSGRSTRSAR
jgi:hypothetical protein